MLTAAFACLAFAALLGTTLAVFHLRAATPPVPPWLLAALHGLLGLAGLSCLLLALGGPPRGVDQGVSAFGDISSALIALAALAGGGLLAANMRKRRSGTLMGLHATLAVSGIVVLAAYLFA
jgi:hypothetical protein